MHGKAAHGWGGVVSAASGFSGYTKLAYTASLPNSRGSGSSVVLRASDYM